MYTDRLGNVGVLSDKNGSYISGSLTLFRPFGDFRREPSTNPSVTDRGYTGHAHNNSGDNDLGLIYMRARYFLPEAGRFISADTLVPDPMNPQALNRYSYVGNNPLKYIDPTGHCAMTSDGSQDPDDQACWDQFFGVYAYLQSQGIDNIALLLGAGKDWELISDPNAYLTSDGVHITLLDFLKIRARHFNDQGYYCSGVACIEESYFGGDYSPFLDSSTSPIVCGIAAVVSGGGASGCILVGWYDTFSNCFESDPGTCIGDFVIDEIAGRTFSLIFTPAAQGFARSLGRELTSDAAVDLFGTATNNGGIGNALTVAVGGTDTVNAPPLCEFSTCASRILDYFANNP